MQLPLEERRALHFLWSQDLAKHASPEVWLITLQYPNHWLIAQAAFELTGAPQPIVIEAFHSDRTFFIKALRKYPNMLKYASPSELADQEIVETALKQSISVYEYAPQFFNNKDMVLKTIEFSGDRGNVSRYFPADRDIARAILSRPQSPQYYYDHLWGFSDYIKNDRELVSIAAKNTFIGTVPDLFRDDIEIMCNVLRRNNRAVEQASPRLKSDRIFICVALFFGASLNGVDQTMRQRLLQDHKYASLALAKNVRNYEYISPELQADRQFAIDAITRWPEGMKYAPPQIRSDTFFIELAIKKRFGGALQFATKEESDCDELVSKAIHANGTAFQFASTRLRQCPNMAKKAIQRHPEAICYFTGDLSQHKELVLEAVKYPTGRVLHLLSEFLKKDKEVLIAALNSVIDVTVLELFNASDETLRSDPDVALAALRQDTDIWMHLGSLKADKDFLLKALEAKAFIYRLLPPELQHDRAITLKAVSRSGRNYSAVPMSMKSDKAIILAAFEQNPSIIEELPEAFITKDMALKAVTSDGTWLGSLPRHLKDDFDIVSAAIRENTEALDYLQGSRYFFEGIAATD